jgi:O-antigen/teichoic acid export membrane protein
MEIGKHLDKGIWGLADKALPVAYGVGFVLLVIPVLAENEFGNFVLVQEIFLIISGLATAFALQPMLKFASEENADVSGIVSASLLLNATFLGIASLVVMLMSGLAGSMLHSAPLSLLLLYVPAMLAASFARNVTMTILQARFRIREVFWVDAMHFLGAPFLVWVVSRMHEFDSAFDLVVINIVSLSASSAVGIWCTRDVIRRTGRPSRDAIRRVWEYGRYSIGGVVSSLFSTRADSFILAAFTGPVQVAVYNSAKVFVRVYEMGAQVAQMFVLPAASRLSSAGDTASLKVLAEKSILFLTVGLLPVSAVFLLFPEVLVTVLYRGRYADAIPVLRLFALLTLFVPVAAVGSNLIMGLGHARASFALGLQCLAATVAAFLVCIPLFGGIGAGVGSVLSALLIAALTVRALRRYVPLDGWAILGRTRDITAFVKKVLFSDMTLP